ncbi:MAG: DUF6036 family nucleotidyltransferase [Verrucomicrobiota bacterium]
MKLSGDLREFIELLNSKKVDYLVVGAHALAWHGLPRYTGDLDFFISSDPENTSVMIDVLDKFGFSSLGLKEEDLQIPDSVIQLGVAPNRIDLLTGLSGVTWEEAWASREKGKIDGLPVFLLSKSDLLRNKIATGRPQDLADVERLKDLEES